jgi:hypothetical protein
MAVKEEIIDDIMNGFLDEFGSVYVYDIRKLVEYAFRKGYESAIDNYMVTTEKNSSPHIKNTVSYHYDEEVDEYKIKITE